MNIEVSLWQLADQWVRPVATARQSLWLRAEADKLSEVYRHKKTGGIYAIVCYANREGDGVELVVYRNVETGDVWVRPRTEFEDGRFELVV